MTNLVFMKMYPFDETREQVIRYCTALDFSALALTSHFQLV